MGSDANCLEAPAEILKVISTDKSAQETGTFLIQTAEKISFYWFFF